MRTLAAVLVLIASPGTQEEETLAITHLRILTVAKGEIPSGTIVIKGDKIAAAGADVKPPAGARVIDGAGLVAFPGMIHPLSRLGTPEGAAGGGSTQHLAFDEINPSLELLSQAARSGYTTFAVQPAGGVVSGQGAILKPSGWTREEQIVEKAAFLRFGMSSGTANKEALRGAMEAGKKAIEGEKKTPPAKPDERVAPLARFLKGDLPGIVELGSASDLLHFWQVMEPYSEFKPRLALAGPVDAYKAAAELGARKARVILRPTVTFAPFTRDRINVAAELNRAGADVAFAPYGDTPDALQGTLFRVAELVKYGLPRDKALRAVTLAPAEFLGIEKRVGSIEAGKDADVLLFSGDPLSSQSRLVEIYLNGKPILHGN